MTEREELDSITREVIGGAIEVHRTIGPGLLESTYQVCLVHELRERGMVVAEQVPLPVRYKGVRLECGYRLDLLVNDRVVIEVKSVEAVMPIHRAQLLSYLKLSGYKMGLLINFNVSLLRDGVVRLVNGTISTL
ncbi:MAG: GxxExxY protein [Chloroflexi bacterium RBG_16_64_43]|nr:MAG: GxxExxY protein [Chloroflexi bacterium RBG_16_64_43]